MVMTSIITHQVWFVYITEPEAMSLTLRERPAAMTNCTNTGFRPQNPPSEEDRNLNTNTASTRRLMDLEREVNTVLPRALSP